MVRWRIVLMIAVVAGGWAWTTPASAADGVRLSGTAGWAGKCQSGRAVLVEATVAADRLVSGVLSVEQSGPSPATEVAVEVVGGSEEKVALVANGPFACSGMLTLRLRERGSPPIATPVSSQPAGGTVLLGLLPGARAGGDQKVSVKGRTGPASVAAVEPDLLDLPGAIDGLDSIGATGAELDQLTPPQASALELWVAAGGTLLVDAERPEELGGLPEAWRPPPAGRVEAGRGQVRLTGTALRDGRIDGLAEPSGGTEPDRVSFGALATNGDLGTLLRRSSGLRVLSLPVLLGALAIYVLLVGPGMRIGLRRLGRLELTWLAIPATALVFSGLAVAGGDLLRSGGKATHLSVLDTAAAGARARTVVGVPTRNKQTVTADLPAGWLAGDLGFDAQLGRSSVRATPTGQRLQASGQAGGFVVLGGEGPNTVEGRLDVRLDPDKRHGTVRNELSVALEDVAVFTPSAVVGIGRLEAGATSPFTSPSGLEPTAPQSLAVQEWGGPDVRLADPDAFSLLAELNPLATGPSLTVAGWTDQLASPVAVRGKHPPGTTLVLGRPQTTSLTGEPVDISSENLMTLRFVVPADAPYRLMGTGSLPESDLREGPQVLVGERWVPTAESSFLPSEAAAGGVVYVRIPVRGPVAPALEPA